ncbi:hypothetical protein KFE25_012970 [Diacronema lutheri]|uniref:Uncharacterized protein n=1 Tax=Diacronema lutheri TaxID=2081491 RepID=A0A8J5XEN3_DIALT|nr:hypothetical protein KFE25_012970 [Diacronema lutheri]
MGEVRSQLAGDVARALDQIIVHMGELYADLAHETAAVEGACDDAADALRSLEREAAAPDARAGAGTPAAAGAAPCRAALDGRCGRVVASKAGAACSAAPPTPGRATAPAPARARPAAATCQRLQLLHAALGRCAAEYGLGAPAQLGDSPSADEMSFLRALLSTQGAPPAAAAAAAAAIPAADGDGSAARGARAYGELCAAHGASVEHSRALRAAVERALDRGARGHSEDERTEAREVAAQCARLLLRHGEELRAAADCAQFERLGAAAARHRARCLAALAPREPAADAATARAAARAAAPRDAGVSGAAEALGARDRVHYRSARELEARCRALHAARAHAAQLSVGRCVAERALPLVGRLARAQTFGRGALLAAFRLVHAVLCARGGRLAVFLAHDQAAA